ncbi:maltose ABC transporter substrate-binding protein [Paenibacillus daejeonensis]|uniref:sugar ABC transporter substrate-binding protein n=1 Tax=Paenibacillus daejeonensis TaxID=135193 RepID=UPI0003646118|nr:maltose ABC transporter substrate-binding protein [Paenibacillus daejeonensis]
MNQQKKKNASLQTMLMLCLSATLVLSACSNNGGGSNNPVNGGTNTPPAGTVNNGETNDPEDEELAPEEGAELVVWESKEQLEYMRILAADFEAEYGVPVTIEELAGGEQGGRLATDGPSKLAADVLTMPHDQIGQAVTAGLLLPNDVFEEETRASMVEAAVTASTYDGVLYGYPKSVETYGLFYNQDLMPEAPETWDDVIAFAKDYNNPGQNQYGIMWEFVGYYTYPFIGSFGGYIFGNDNMDPSDIGLNSEGTVEGFTFLQSLREILPMNAGDVTYDVKTQLFQEGKLAMNIDGPWSVAAFKDKVNFGVVPLPSTPNGDPSQSFSGVKSYYVNSYSEYPIAARLFAQFASSKENQLKNFEMTGAIPANIEAGEDPAIQDDPITSGFFQQFTNSTPMPSISQINSVWDPLKAAFISVWDDPNVDVKQMLDQTVTTIKADIDSK